MRLKIPMRERVRDVVVQRRSRLIVSTDEVEVSVTVHVAECDGWCIFNTTRGPGWNVFVEILTLRSRM